MGELEMAYAKTKNPHKRIGVEWVVKSKRAKEPYFW